MLLKPELVVDSMRNMRILIFMATRNVYVSTGDVDLFDRAAELAGGLSTAVVAGLRLFVAAREREQGVRKMQQIEVEVNDGPVITVKRFTGRRLLRFENQDGPRVTTYRVYATAGEQIAVYQRDEPNWRAFASPDEDSPVWSDEKTWSDDWWRSGQRSLAVFSDTAAMATELPQDLISAIVTALARPEVEDLEI